MAKSKQNLWDIMWKPREEWTEEERRTMHTPISQLQKEIARANRSEAGRKAAATRRGEATMKWVNGRLVKTAMAVKDAKDMNPDNSDIMF